MLRPAYIVPPDHPGTQPLHQVTATQAQITAADRQYDTALEVFRCYSQVLEALRDRIVNGGLVPGESRGVLPKVEIFIVPPGGRGDDAEFERAAQRIGDDRINRAPDLLGVVLDPTRLRVVLPELAVSPADDGAVRLRMTWIPFWRIRRPTRRWPTPWWPARAAGVAARAPRRW